MQTQNLQENNVLECLPGDRKAYMKAYYEANKEKHKAYYEANKDQLKEQKKAYYEANKEQIKASEKTYREANKEKIKKQQKAYYEANKERRKQKHKAYYEANKEKIVEHNTLYQNKRLKEDPLFAAKYKLRQLVTHSFRRIGKNKPTDTLSLLGCSWIEAKEHFERLFKEGMTWGNHGLWHIDHIRPVASFSEDELHLMNLISNLQPLWAEDNNQKSDKF